MQYIFIYLQYLRHLFIITVCSYTVYAPFNFAMWKLKAEFFNAKKDYTRSFII